ncbi:MAG TPA: ABC transporter permease [Vicinamibacterales bacterium]|nr:ABC transporter permease [Vicinamibacterales bacterium]
MSDGFLPSPSRAVRMVQRNMMVYKHGWMVIFSGFFEPLFYLFSIGLGIGAMVRNVNGVSYTAFVVPGLLASSCMNGAITDGFFNIFFKLHFQKTYDGILNTPMRVADIVFGEMLWAIMRGSTYAAAFLMVVLIVERVTGSPLLLSWWALLAWPAAVLAASAFSASAVCITSIAKKIQDFDIVIGLVVMPMFLFAGTFFPVESMPLAARWVVYALPLYHAVAMLRQLTIGAVEPTIVLHVAYLVALGTAAFLIAMYRLERALIK